jgi:hypothetical protein
MALTKFTINVDNIQALSDKPNEIEGLTPDQLKAKFDKAPKDIKDYINDTITEEVDTINADVETRLSTAETNIDNLQTGWNLLQTGWNLAGETWTYASSTTITVPSGANSKYSKGDKIKLTQTNTVKYFYVVNVEDSLLTITGGSDYSLIDATISNNYYSHEENPTNFPAWFNWTCTTTSLTIGNGTVVAKFKIHGGSVTSYSLTKLGSTSSVAGNMSQNLPINPVSGYETVANTKYYGNSANQFGFGLIENNIVQIYALVTSGSYGTAATSSATVPFTWATGNSIAISVTYPYTW